MSAYKVRVNGKEFEVNLLSREGSSLTFSMNGTTYVAEIAECLGETGAAPAVAVQTVTQRAAPRKNTQTNGVTAPMPGVIVKILVKSGQQVKIGEPLLTIEAMKMENHIKAPRDGAIKSILVGEGEEVRANQPLVEYSA